MGRKQNNLKLGFMNPLLILIVNNHLYKDFGNKARDTELIPEISNQWLSPGFSQIEGADGQSVLKIFSKT